LEGRLQSREEALEWVEAHGAALVEESQAAPDAD
jgi:hypothetical protein